MPRLSLRRRRRTKLDTVKDLAQIYTTLKLSQAGGRAAKKAAKGYAGVKAAKGGRKVAGPRPGARWAITALVAFLKKRNQRADGLRAPGRLVARLHAERVSVAGSGVTAADHLDRAGAGRRARGADRPSDGRSRARA